MSRDWIWPCVLCYDSNLVSAPVLFSPILSSALDYFIYILPCLCLVVKSHRLYCTFRRVSCFPCFLTFVSRVTSWFWPTPVFTLLTMDYPTLMLSACALTPDYDYWMTLNKPHADVHTHSIWIWILKTCCLNWWSHSRVWRCSLQRRLHQILIVGLHYAIFSVMFPGTMNTQTVIVVHYSKKVINGIWSFQSQLCAELSWFKCSKLIFLTLYHLHLSPFLPARLPCKTSSNVSNTFVTYSKNQLSFSTQRNKNV